MFSSEMFRPQVRAGPKGVFSGQTVKERVIQNVCAYEPTPSRPAVDSGGILKVASEGTGN